MSKYSENIPPSIIGAIGWFYEDVAEGSTVLDIGCSTGYYGAYIKKHKHSKVYGVEISDDRKEAAKVLDGVYSFDLDGDWSPELAERKYDVIFMGDVIEHLKDPTEALRKAKELLSPNGRIFVSTPNVAHLSIRLELLGGNFEYEKMGILDSTHLKYFTHRSLTQIAADAGLAIDRIDSSESDYPREITQAILDKYGLKATKKFWELASDPTARAFQYKLVLRDAQGKKTTIPEPAQKPEQYRQSYISELHDIVERQQAQIEEHKQARQKLHAEVEGLNKSLETVVSSKAYKVAVRLQQAKKKIKRGGGTNHGR